jgi:hypothetical protein
LIRFRNQCRRRWGRIKNSRSSWTNCRKTLDFGFLPCELETVVDCLSHVGETKLNCGISQNYLKIDTALFRPWNQATRCMWQIQKSPILLQMRFQIAWQYLLCIMKYFFLHPIFSLGFCLAGADWALCQCGKCRGPLPISHIKSRKKGLFEIKREILYGTPQRPFFPVRLVVLGSGQH